MIRILAQIWRLIPFRMRLALIRISQKKFTVSVVAIVLNAEGEVLILDHYIRPGTTWGLPGGFIQKHEHPEEAIRRELKEETTLDLENLVLIQIRTVGKHLEILFRAGCRGEVRVDSSEIRGFGWFPHDALPGGISKVQSTLIKSFAVGPKR